MNKLICPMVLLLSIFSLFNNVRGDCKAKPPLKPIPPRDWTYFVDVIDMEAKTFEYDLTCQEFSLVLFCEYWNEKCQAIWEDYKIAAQPLVLHDPMINLDLLECDKTVEYQSKCLLLGIEQVPMLKIYHRGEYKEDYTGSLKPNDIISFMEDYAKKNCKCGCSTPCKGQGGTCGCLGPMD